MDLGSAFRVLLRRWVVVLLGALLTLGAAAYVYTQVPSRYQSTARMLLLLPADSRGEAEIGSPFLYLPNGLNVLAGIVAATPTSRDFRAQLVVEGFSSQFEVGVDNSSPTITVSVEGSDPQDVIETRDRLIQAINLELLTVQQEESAPVNQVAHARVYGTEAAPVQIGGDRMRAVLAVGGVGALLTLILVFAIDRLSLLRRARRADRVPGEKQSRRERRKARSEASGGAAAPAGEFAEQSDGEDPTPQSQDAGQDPAEGVRFDDIPDDAAGIPDEATDGADDRFEAVSPSSTADARA